MRHHNANRKFGRPRDLRQALLRSLARDLVAHGQITTTTARAKELRPFIEKLVTHSKKGGLAGQRLIGARLGRVKEAQKLMREIAPRYESRSGGYTRIIKLPERLSDGSPMAIIQFV